MKKTQHTPRIPSTLWQAFHSAAHSLHMLEPWKKATKESIFAVQLQDSPEIFYCVWTGEEELGHTLLAYRGRRALETHLQIVKTKQEWKEPVILGTYDALVVDFTSWEELSPSEKRIAKKENYTPPFPPFWYPSCRSYQPGYQGWSCDKKELQSLIHILTASALHYTQPHKLLAPQIIPLYTQDEENHWQIQAHLIQDLLPLPTPPLCIDVTLIDDVKGTKLYYDGAWEASFFYTPAVILDKQRPYFARACMIVHQDSLFLLHLSVMAPETCPYTYLAQELLNAMKTHTRLPAEICVDSPELLHALHPLTKTLGIEITLLSSLPATKPAKEGLLEYMQKK